MAYASGTQSEVVLFFGARGVCKALLYSDFEAVLDGVVGMQEFAGQNMKAAYATVNGRHQVTGLVLFTIGFDAGGVADRTWNIPLRHMVERADRGPDLGAGPIQLACRSQCPINWHQEQLWDPNMRPEANDFVFVRDAVKERAKYLGLPWVEEAEPAPLLSPAAFAAPLPGAGAAPAAVPVLAPADVPVIAVAAPPVAAAAAVPVVTSAGSLDGTLDLIDQLREERVKLARTVKDLRLQITTMETEKNEEVARINYAFQQKEEILSSQLDKVLSQFQSIKAQNAALREQGAAQRAQIDSLHEALERQTHEAQQGESQLEEMRRQVQQEMNQRLEEESAKVREELHVREMDIISRDDQIAQLREELAEARRNQDVSREAGADKFLEKLEKLGVNFIAFHPGAGHISIPFRNIQRYVENPQAYAAEKCLVTEDRYRAWLAHYENPVCGMPKADGKPCGARLIRIDVPSKFKPGDSDVCPKCQGDKNIANVLAFR